MIELIDNYVILINDLDYALARKTGKTDKKTGNPVYIRIGYFGTISGALERLVEICTRNALKDGVWGLQDAVRVIKEVGDSVTKALCDVTEGR